MSRSLFDRIYRPTAAELRARSDRLTATAESEERYASALAAVLSSADCGCQGRQACIGCTLEPRDLRGIYYSSRRHASECRSAAREARERAATIDQKENH